MLRHSKGFWSRRLRLLRWASWFSACNGLLLALFALNFTRYMPEFGHWLQPGYLATALIGHFASLSYLVFVLLWLPLVLVLPWPRLVRRLAVLAATLGMALLVVDYVVYSQYRFHLNGVLLNLVIADGGTEIFIFSWLTWLLAFLVVLLIFAGQWLLGGWLKARLQSGRRMGGGWLAVMIVTSLLASHGIHIWADARYDQRITGLTRHLPFYYPTTGKTFLRHRGWVDLDKNREEAQRLLKRSGGSGTLNYPKAPLSCRNDDDPMNLLMIVIDSWRFDELEPRVSPFLHGFGRESQTLTFEHHFSGGNSTQAGMFSLMYGLPSSYWSALAAGMHGPVLIDRLLEADYQPAIFASARLTHPAFDRTLFASIEGLRTESAGKNPWQRDREVNREWADFLSQRDRDRPFFGFLFYDAAHGYSFPDGAHRPYEPVWGRVDHVSLSPSLDPVPYFNRHRAAVRYVDGLVEEAVEALKQQGLYDETLILITSDHGEEFNDNGQNFWGHGSNYTRYQVQVPLMIRRPGQLGGPRTYRTSHMDVAPTLLQTLLGCTNPAEDYSIGRHLLDATPRDWLYAGSYFNYAILLDEAILVTYPTGNYEILDLANRPLPERSLEPRTSLAILQALSRFYH